MSNLIKIDVDNYPAFKEIMQKDTEEFTELLKNTFTHVDKAVKEGHYERSKELYKMEYIEFLETLSDAFFKFNGIVNQHANHAERVGLSGLGEDIHPLAIFTNDVPVFDAHGRNISPYEWIPLDQFDLKNWLYALFYGARFVSWKELAEYLTLDKYDMIDVLKANNFKQLQKIQPALAYQDKQGITKGKLIAGTGYLECGSRYHEICPACEKGVLDHRHSSYSNCPECSAGFIK